ncbi:MAG: class II fructose-bisphosphate aldolase [Pseudomonadota bacterium]|jgi:fructose-bisphosphate aldolase class II
MPLVHLKDLLRHTRAQGYAVGAYDAVDSNFCAAILDGAERARAPVIVSFAESHFAHYDFAVLVAAAEAAARRSSVPVALFLDDGAGLDSAVAAIRNGCNGVMADASHLAFDDNVAATRAVVDMAHAVGVPVECELGYVPGVEGEDALRHSGDIRPTSPAEAARYVQATGVDFLAVSVGTVHGRMVGLPQPVLQRLAEIAKAVAAPPVVHGGTGLTDAQFRALPARGVVKINYYTALPDACAAAAAAALARPGTGYTAATDAVRDAVVAEAARTCEVFDAAGRAAGALEACRPSREVEHLIRFNWSDGAAGRKESMARVGAQGMAELDAAHAGHGAQRAPARRTPRLVHPAGERAGRGRLHGASGSPQPRRRRLPASRRRRRPRQGGLPAGLTMACSCTIPCRPCRSPAAYPPAATDCPPPCRKLSVDR